MGQMGTGRVVRLPEETERTRLYALLAPEEREQFARICGSSHLTLEQGLGNVIRRAIRVGSVAR